MSTNCSYQERVGIYQRACDRATERGRESLCINSADEVPRAPVPVVEIKIYGFCYDARYNELSERSQKEGVITHAGQS